VVHRVPLGRRNLFSDTRRLVASVAGVGLALMLILLLDGLWEGIRTKVTVYEDNVGADLYVAQAGTQNFFGGESTIPAATVADVRNDPDVEWAAPIRGFFSILDMHGTKVPVYVVGSEPGQPGGPWSITRGRAPGADDEVVVGRGLVDRHGVAIDDRFDLLGRSFTVVGVDSQADAFMASFVFLTHAAADEVLASTDTTSFVLVGTDRPDEARERIAEQTGLAVLDVGEIRENDRALMTRAYGTPMAVMVAVALGAGSLVIALTAYAAISERRREYGIVKAMGAGSARLTKLAVGQSLALAVMGMAAGWLLFVAGRVLVVALRPQFSIVATPGSALRAAAAAVVMGLVAALIPARRLATLDPATAYRGG
jgi:putative ABC transport system permease protein